MNLQLESMSWDPSPLTEVPDCTQAEICNILGTEKRNLASGVRASLLHKIWPKNFSSALQFPHKELCIRLIL